MKQLYIEAFSGLSGDMFLGAFMSLTGKQKDLITLPQKLKLDHVDITVETVSKNGIVCPHVKVSCSEKNFEKERHITDIFRIIDKADLNAKTKKIAKEIFMIVGQAESKIHNIPLEKIHFHELSGADSIVDIVGNAMFLAELDIEKTFAEPVCTGYGFVQTKHGKLPIPAPATMEILQAIPFYKGDEPGERTTPTGAAILKYLNPDFNPPPLSVHKTAYGAGEKNFITPNVLRISLVTNSNPKNNTIFQMETNIDDMSPELLGKDFQDKLFNKGALDFHLTSALMKKGRSGWVLTVLCPLSKINELSEYILENTSSNGLRFFKVKRNVLERKTFIFNSSLGKIQIKSTLTPTNKIRNTLEYDDLVVLSKQHNLPLLEVQERIFSELKENSSNSNHEH